MMGGRRKAYRTILRCISLNLRPHRLFQMIPEHRRLSMCNDLALLIASIWWLE